MNEELSNNDNLERELKEAAEDFQMQPSPAVWTNMKDTLHPRRRNYAWLWVAAGLLLLAGLGTYFIIQHERSAPLISSTEKPKSVIAEKSISPGQLSTDASKETSEEKTAQQLSRKPTPQTDEAKASGTFSVPTKSTVASGQTETALTGTRTGLSSEANSYVLPFLKKTSPDFIFESLTDIDEALLAAQEREVDRNPSLPVASEIFPERDEDKIKKPESKVKKPGTLSWEFSFTPAWSYRSLKIDKSTPGNLPGPPSSDYMNNPSLSGNLAAVQARQDKTMKQRPGWGWNAAARLSLQLKKNWQLQTGISIAHTSYRILAYGAYPAYVQNNGNASTATNNNSNSWFIASAVVPDPVPDHLDNQYLNAEIPLLLGKEFGQPNKVSFSILAGTDLSYMINSESIMYAPGSKRYFTDEKYLKTFNGNLHLETIFQIPLGKKLHFLIGPSFQYQLFSTYKNYPQVKEHPYLLGIRTGIRLNK